MLFLDIRLETLPEISPMISLELTLTRSEVNICILFNVLLSFFTKESKGVSLTTEKFEYALPFCKERNYSI